MSGEFRTINNEIQVLASYDPADLVCEDIGANQSVDESIPATQDIEVVHINAAELVEIQSEYERSIAEDAHSELSDRIIGSVIGGGKKVAGAALGFLDAVMAFKAMFGIPAETPLPWEEDSYDQIARRAGYGAGMAANAALTAWGTTTTASGLATASTCGTIAGGGALAAETGVGAVVAVGGGACAMGGLATAAAGAAMAGFGGTNIARVREDYGKRDGGYGRMGGNRGQNKQFAGAGRRLLAKMGIDPKSARGMDLLRRAHDIMGETGRRGGGFGDCIDSILEAAAGAGIIIKFESERE